MYALSPSNGDAKWAFSKGGVRGAGGGSRLYRLLRTPLFHRITSLASRSCYQKKKNFQITDFKQKSHIPWGKNALPFERDRAYIFLTLISQFFWIKWFFKIFSKKYLKKIHKFWNINLSNFYCDHIHEKSILSDRIVSDILKTSFFPRTPFNVCISH